MKNGNFSQGAESKSNKIYRAISQEVLNFLENVEPINCEIPWIFSENSIGAHNVITKRPYTGVYQIYLSCLCSKNGYKFNRWLNPRQIYELGAKIKKGENPSILNVYNIEQCEGLPHPFFAPYARKEADFDPIGKAELIMETCGATIEFSEETYYNLSLDHITFAQRKKFKNIPTFYNHVFTKIGLWTGHPEILDRELFNKKNSKAYIWEELTSQMCSVFINSACGIDIKIKHSANFVNAFVKAMKEQPEQFVLAVMRGQAAASYILERTKTKKQQHNFCDNQSISFIAA